MRQVILKCKNLTNRIKQLINGFEKAVAASSLLKMTPEALNRVQHGAIGRQPKDHWTVFKVSQYRLWLSTVMIRGIVQNDNNRPFPRSCLHEVFDKDTKWLCIFRFCRGVNKFVGTPVVGTKEVPSFLLTWCWNAYLLTSLHPATNDNRQQAYRCFVHKE